MDEALAVFRKSSIFAETDLQFSMAITDTIHRITMIEAGVSRMVPVDLRELA